MEEFIRTSKVIFDKSFKTNVAAVNQPDCEEESQRKRNECQNFAQEHVWSMRGRNIREKKDTFITDYNQP